MFRLAFIREGSCVVAVSDDGRRARVPKDGLLGWDTLCENAAHSWIWMYEKGMCFLGFSPNFGPNSGYGTVGVDHGSFD